ncbi:MAG: hypothetical protein JGK17_16880 [Microcoleus sp. PH2017_10_PVI_O_A]|uniref:hypothetical protein n=1 Tax=unclassified Microcoleus TaxID=2642155 RepID=UPI001D857470|nr:MULTISPECIES: hypothetical protein [unclassified Microcoleus]MCC3407235.1 hypothetical protein [Microcoleus sp. PH2017_10_PVI_O_A]MCC3461328.1 hypothetical protein [Microcoleus sp. PH2017_11_PCY_U_A]MCC3479766.1 hypothetical protein [Microcoleus sp. PH2017_12_PCY_D_A]MCC3529569.1 hypothetical protein [Microcoleus sp. PH2017_21_RUC_O_A]MCC3542265.1 hypothetical protein [Microcoleus sp. PH2017_22_RUC_O_B]
MGKARPKIIKFLRTIRLLGQLLALAGSDAAAVGSRDWSELFGTSSKLLSQAIGT